MPSKSATTPKATKAKAVAKPQVQVSLDDKYTLTKGRVFITGSQALVRLPMLQHLVDKQNGLNTAGFISGYRGSPLARLDQQLWQAEAHLKEHHIKFTPGINEDLGATAVWGSQQTSLFPGARYDGVFGLWYGKGPGVDRSMDVIKHANAAGTAPNGGVLALMGDDHGCVSSTLGHQSEHDMIAAMVPVLYPATVQEYLDFGLLGIAMSRFAGCWVGLKCATETVESSASIEVDISKATYKIPADAHIPEGGLNIRMPDPPLQQEQRLQAKVAAAVAFARANKVDQLVLDAPKAKLGIITSGKSYKDVLQAMDDLGLDEATAKKLGIRIYKVGLVWPLEPQGALAFAKGLDEILVVEEKREMIEQQLRSLMYDMPDAKRPRVVGKYDDHGKELLNFAGDHTPAKVALAIAARVDALFKNSAVAKKAGHIAALEAKSAKLTDNVVRLPYYCAGCPHNTSTKVPEGSRAIAGIGCHYMVQWMNRNSNIITHMGGEGVNWIGHAPFTDEKHVFANLGDGTYYHSGSLAIRAAVSAGVNITYKILYNDAVAMTGGQPVEGGLTVQQISQQMHAEGVKKICVVSDEPEKYTSKADFAPGIIIKHRDDLDDVQNDLRQTPGVTVMIYDQTCAAEKRRRRKRGLFPDPDKRVFINDLVCEGCGDCSVQSNCVAVLPKETELGRKRQIDQSNCNKDYSCVKGFCPSFVTVAGAKIKKLKAGAAAGDNIFASLPMPKIKPLEQPYNVLITGIGGTGVITIGAVLGMAAHLEGKGVTVLDQTGLAQKNGAVMSHLRIGKTPEQLHAVRIATGNTDLLLGCDMVVAANHEALGRLSKEHTKAVVNSHMTPTAGFTLNPDIQFHETELMTKVKDTVGAANTTFIEATKLASTLMGDTIATNMFMLGYAFQKGLIPLQLESIEEATRLNGVAVAANIAALNWGRLAADDAAKVMKVVGPALNGSAEPISETLDELIERRFRFLTDYQDAAYATRYRQLVDKVRAAEAAAVKGSTELTEAVARYGFKLMAYKDEWEVARLYTSGEFERKLKETFDGKLKLKFHLAPPLLAPKDSHGHLKKMTFGPWVLPVFRTLAKMRFLRGTALDVFGYTAERRAERQLIEDYFSLVDEMLAHLNAKNHLLAVALARVPEEIRGYGHIKARNMELAAIQQAKLLAQFRAPDASADAADVPLPGPHLSTRRHKVNIVMDGNSKAS